MSLPGGTRRSFALRIALAAWVCAGMIVLTGDARQSAAAPTERVNRSVGGGPAGGDVASLIIIDSRPPVLLASFVSGGVFRSTDGGASWTLSDTGLPESCWCDLRTDPINPQVVVAGSVRDSDTALYRSDTALYRSVDQGRHWVYSGDGPPRYRWKSSTEDRTRSASAIDPRDPSVGYQATEAVTRDGGMTWRASNRGLPVGAKIVALAIDPSVTGTVYAGTEKSGLFKTTTAGDFGRVPTPDCRMTTSRRLS